MATPTENGSGSNAAPKPTHRSRITNGPAFMPGVVGRSTWARLARDVRAAMVDLLHRAVTATQTETRLRALTRDRAIKPESVQRYLENEFGDALDDSYDAMMPLARSKSHTELAAHAYRFYEDFRPEVPSGAEEWGAAGRLDLDKIRQMADRD